MTEYKEPSQKANQASPPSPWRKRLSITYLTLYWLVLAFLLVMYLFVGDTSAFGEFFTIFPGLAWVVGLIPMAMLLKPLVNTRQLLVGLAGIVVFLVATEEWRSLFRLTDHEERERFEEIRSIAIEGESSEQTIPLRVLVWNLDSTSKREFLPVLEELEPDLCFLQETPDGANSIADADLKGYWEGWHWIDAGDCGLFSRYPIEELDSAVVGPWSDPLCVELEVLDQKILLVNVRLTLPNLSLNVFSSEGRERYARNTQERIDQFPKLVELIEGHAYDSVILAGDINTPAQSRSMNPLEAILKDAWLEGGRGWGRTILADFPISRIDQCWVSENFECIHGETRAYPLSDHRLVLFELILPKVQ